MLVDFLVVFCRFSFLVLAEAKPKIWHHYQVRIAENPESKNTDQPASSAESMVEAWLPLPDVAEILDVSITKVHALLDERALLAIRIGERKIRSVPAEFLAGDRVVDSLKGTFAVLLDAGYSDEEAIVWLFTADETLPGRPIDALHAGRKTEIRRRAQALAW